MKHHRLLGFDLLRGICAIAIAIYHILQWEMKYALYNIGPFGVYIFFMLSGASLIIGYEDKLKSGMKFTTFIARRYFRLAPLYWLILLSRHAFGSKTNNTLLNMSFLFGFANPGVSARLAVAWSLGIEFVFYFTFPLFLALSEHKYRQWMWLVIALAVQTAYVHDTIVHTTDWQLHWPIYIQFSSFIGYFFIGCIIGRVFIEHPDILVKRIFFCWSVFLILLTMIGFICINSDYTAVAGWVGFYLTVACAMLVFIAGCLHIPSWFSKVAMISGAMSYGVYLLHMRIYEYMKHYSVLRGNGVFFFGAVMITTTIIVALLLDRYFEMPIKKYGYRLLSMKKTCAIYDK